MQIFKGINLNKKNTITIYKINQQNLAIYDPKLSKN